MFTSLNVVRIAAVDCDCTRRSATRWRRRDIGTRCSGRAPRLAGDRAAGGGFARRGCGAGAAAAAGRPRPARASTAASTSPLVMRPPRPVPATSAGSMPCSAIILRAAGSAVGAALRTARGAGGAAAGAAPSARRAPAAAACRRGAAPPRPPLASVSMTAMTSLRRDRRAVGLHDLDQHAVARRRQLEHDLVGLDVDQVLVALDRLAGLLVPADQRRLGDRLGQLRHFDFDAHDSAFSSVSARRTISPRCSFVGEARPRSAAFCCSMCLRR